MQAFAEDLAALLAEWDVWRVRRADNEARCVQLDRIDAITSPGQPQADQGVTAVAIHVAVSYPRGVTRLVDLALGRLYDAHNARISEALDNALLQWSLEDEEEEHVRRAHAALGVMGVPCDQANVGQPCGGSDGYLYAFLMSQACELSLDATGACGPPQAAVAKETPRTQRILLSRLSLRRGSATRLRREDQWATILSRVCSGVDVGYSPPIVQEVAATEPSVLLFFYIPLADWSAFRCHALNLKHDRPLEVAMKWRSDRCRITSNTLGVWARPADGCPAPPAQSAGLEALRPLLGSLADAEVLALFQPDRDDITAVASDDDQMECAMRQAAHIGTLNWYMVTTMQKAVHALGELWNEQPGVFVTDQPPVTPTERRLEAQPDGSPGASRRVGRGALHRLRLRTLLGPVSSHHRSGAAAESRADLGQLLVRSLTEVRESTPPGTVVNVIRVLRVYARKLMDTCTDSCFMCGSPLVMQSVRMGICNAALCEFGVEQFDIGVDVLAEVVSHPSVIELLVYLTCASAHSEKRDTLSPMCPVDITSSLGSVALAGDGRDAPWGTAVPASPYNGPTHFYKGEYGNNDRKNFRLLRQIIQLIPPLSVMVREADGSNARLRTFLTSIHPLVYPLLQWIIRSNRAHLEAIEAPHRIPGLGMFQYILLSSSPEREARFQKRKGEAAATRTKGSFFGWHGSPCHNWHCILREGLKVLSGTQLMSTGQLYGSGIYLSECISTALHYAGKPSSPWAGAELLRHPQGCTLVSLCEVIADPLKYRDHGNHIYTVISEEDIVTRFLFVFPGAFNGKVEMSASSLHISPELMERTSYVVRKQPPAANKRK